MKNKLRNLSIGGKIFIAYIAVLILAMILCSTLVSRYVTGFMRQRTKEYNVRGMSTVVYELDSLYQRLEQFTSTVYDRDVYDFILENGGAFDYAKLKRQIDFEDYIRNSLLLSDLKSDTVGMVIYLDDENYYYIGDGILKKQVKLSETDWYRQFADSGSASTFIGPLQEDYRPNNATAQEVVLYLRRLHVPASVRSDKIPFVMMIVRYESIARNFSVFFGEGGALVSSSDAQTVYAANLTPEQITQIGALRKQGVLRQEGAGLSSYSDKDLLLTSIYAPNFGWDIAAINPAEEIYADVSRVVGTINLMFALCGIVGILLAWIFSRKIMIPIQTLNNMISRMEQGEDTFITIKSDDEVGQIGKRFNAMKRRLQELTSKVYLAEVRKKQAQLEALQAQINPHFLYNSLDNIYCIAQIEGIDIIARLIQNLSSMMRYSIDAADATTRLKDELAHVQQYIEILNLRFDGCIQYTEHVDIGLLEIPVMKLILQPVVENAWIHGIGKKESRSGHILLSAEVDSGILRITVEDDGVGMTAEIVRALNDSLQSITPGVQSSSSGLGIALRNVNDRIKLSSGEEYGIRIDSSPGEGSRVTILLKY